MQYTFDDYAKMAASRENKLWHYSNLLNIKLSISRSECQEIFDLANRVSVYSAMSSLDVVDCVVVGILRGTYISLDNVGLEYQHIKTEYDRIRNKAIHFDKYAWYIAVKLELQRIVYGEPYTVRAQVVDIGNGYGRVEYITGESLIMPSNYKQQIMKTALSKMVIPRLVDTGTLRESIPTIKARVSRTASCAKDYKIELVIKPL